jgi:serine carboxypeptidase 1
MPILYIFKDNPVGTGYSFVENTSLLVTTDEAAASDLTELLKQLYNKNPEMQKSPLYIFAESYGGKYAVTLGLSIVKAVKSGDLKLKLGGTKKKSIRVHMMIIMIELDCFWK